MFNIVHSDPVLFDAFATPIPMMAARCPPPLHDGEVRYLSSGAWSVLIRSSPTGRALRLRISESSVAAAASQALSRRWRRAQTDEECYGVFSWRPLASPETGSLLDGPMKAWN